MIIYNVTCNIPESIETEWVHWMKHVHIPEVIATEKFTGFKMLKLLTNVEDNEGVNYAIQYYCHSIEDYQQYADEFAPALKAKTYERYGEQVLAFRTLLEEV
jgi:DNA-directed RNA polymerase beta' subunit